MSLSRTMIRSLLSPFWSPSDDRSDANKSSLSDEDSQDSQELSPEEGEIESNPDVNGQRGYQRREEVNTTHKKAPYVSVPPLLRFNKEGTEGSTQQASSLTQG